MTKILLSSVFGPYAVDDAYGRKENIMELFHNQVTREQGVFSLRFNHPSFGLHFMAANVEADVTVLDFPSQRRFVRELKKGYDYVGVTFITPNFVKAKRMAELVRKHAPRSEIVLGGHGTRIPDLEQLIEHDHICRGEGVRWLRELLGEDPDRPIKHPAMPSGVQKRIMGIPQPTDAAVLCPGVGCPNGCRFCSTTHFFDRRYTPYLKTGDDIYRACREIEEKTGYKEFFVMDENFLKQRARAERLVELMERDGKDYSFGIFSSAETIQDVGVDFLARLGVYFLWLGVESKREVYEKNKGIDFHAMVRSLRDAGVGVLASGILFLEHHDRETIWEDVEFMASLEADYVQFMELGPLPRTALYEDYRRRGLLREDVPYEEWHGQDKIWFKHEHFSRDESAGVIKAAFEREFAVNGPSIMRFFETSARGALKLRTDTPAMARRQQQMVDRCQLYRPLLRAIELLAPTPRMKEQARAVAALYAEVLGPETAIDHAKSVGAGALALSERLRIALGLANYQPPTLLSHYAPVADVVTAPAARREPATMAPPVLNGAGR